ncbi:MAG: InlB B-repeat-containing protein [Acidobacteriota bacterium]|nr:InlB B-repeat-containing protein [Acidobacteriota bacterium]
MGFDKTERTEPQHGPTGEVRVLGHALPRWVVGLLTALVVFEMAFGSWPEAIASRLALADEAGEVAAEELGSADKDVPADAAQDKTTAPDPEQEPKDEGLLGIIGDILTPGDGAKAPAAQRLAATVDGDDETIVTVDADAGVLSEGATVKARLVDDQAVIDAVTDEVEGAGGEVGEVKAFDVTLHDAEGNEIQPDGAVKVTFSKTDMPSDDVAVYHVSDDAQKVEKVKTKTADADKQVFETTHFSIYAIADTNPYARLKIVFHKADDSESTVIYANQADFTNGNVDNIVYDPGVGTLGANETFRGWTTDPDYDQTVVPMDIGGVRTLVKNKLQAGVSQDGETLDVYPVVFKVLHVSYLDENESSLGSETLLLLRSESSTSYTVNMAYTPPTAYQDFEGWNVDSGGTNIDGHTAGTVYENGTEIALSGDVVFSVNAPEGHWLVFDENGKGATYNAPQFVKSGQTTTPPSLEMNRVGYDFGGWYTDEACTPGNEFAFDGELEDNTTVYAKWTKATSASYAVLIWKQNVDGAGYDFAESITLNGTVDSTVNTVVSHGSGDGAYASVDGVNKQYTGFHLKEFDQNVTIAAEGTTVVNVYYDRSTVTLTFHVYDYGYTPTTGTSGTQYGLVNGEYVQLTRHGNWWSGYYWTYGNNIPYNGTRYVYSQSWQVRETMTGLYGSRLASNGYTWPTDYWWYENGSANGNVSGTRTTFMDAFLPPTGLTENFYGRAGQGTVPVRFYTQNADGSGYTLTNTMTSSSNATFHISDKYNGFEAVSYSTNNGSSWTTVGDKDPSTGYYASVSNYTNLSIRFDRLQYNVLYQDGVYVDSDGNPVEGYSSRGQLHVVNGVTYGSNMSSYNAGGTNYYEPTYDGFVFSGWYADENCTHPYTFTTMTEGITVYAKWTQIQYRVFLHPNAGTDTTLDWGSSTQSMNFRVTHGGKVSTPTGLRSEYEFVGWYLDEDFTQVFNADAFVLNETTVTTPYDKTVDMTDPMDKWGNGATTNADVDRFWITKKLDLYAKWRATLVGADGIGITYDANGGSNAPHDTLLYLDSADAVAQAASTPANADTHQFMYWVVQTWDESEGKYVDTDEVVFPGDTFTVLKDNAKVVEKPGSTPENPNYTYTVQLRAEYGKKGSPSTTKVIFDANGGTFNGGETTVEGILKVNEKIPVPAEPTRTGYTFEGWGTTADASAAAFPSDPKMSASTGYAADDLDGLAWDESQQANILYAMWKPAVVSVDIYKFIEGEQANLNESFAFTVTRGGTTVQTGSLSNNGKLTVADLNYGDEITITETPKVGYSSKHFESNASYDTVEAAKAAAAAGTSTSGSSVTMTLGEKNSVVFTNTKDNIVITGIKQAVRSPITHILLMALITAAGSVSLTRMRRERRTE